MKKSILLLSAFIFALTNFSFGQKKGKPFTGTIIFNISYSGDIDAAAKAQQPKEFSTKIMGNKTRTEITYGAATITTISNNESKTATTLIDVMGQKYCIKKKAEDIEKDLKDTKYEIAYVDSTRTISDFVCKKAIITVKGKGDDGDVVIPVWYCEDIGGVELNYGGQFHGLKGFAVEYTMTTKGIVTTFSIKEIKKGKVSDTDFLIPTDYKEMTKEQLQQMFGGGDGDDD